MPTKNSADVSSTRTLLVNGILFLSSTVAMTPIGTWNLLANVFDFVLDIPKKPGKFNMVRFSWGKSVDVFFLDDNKCCCFWKFRFSTSYELNRQTYSGGAPLSDVTWSLAHWNKKRESNEYDNSLKLLYIKDSLLQESPSRFCIHGKYYTFLECDWLKRPYVFNWLPIMQWDS